MRSCARSSGAAWSRTATSPSPGSPVRPRRLSWLTAAGLTLDPTTFEIWCRDEKRTRLSPTEFRLLGALAAHAGRTVSRRDLVRAGWPEGALVHDNTIDVYLARLRRKLAGIECAAG